MVICRYISNTLSLELIEFFAVPHSFFSRFLGEKKSMPLRIGQKVAYPSQGVCRVEQIEQRTVGSTSMQFYSLRVLNDNSIIFVPLENADSVGIRPVISQIQCKRLI